MAGAGACNVTGCHTDYPTIEVGDNQYLCEGDRLCG